MTSAISAPRAVAICEALTAEFGPRFTTPDLLRDLDMLRGAVVDDLAVAAQDARALRRVAHNLKSVLTMLGEAPAAQCARSTEEWAAGGDSDLLQQGWRQLRQQVLRVVSVQGES